MTFRSALLAASLLAANLVWPPGPLAAQAAEPAGADVAEAPAEPAEPTDEQKAAAREAYGAGQAAFSAGDWQKALTEFEAAYAAVSNPVVLKPIAECQIKLGRFGPAVITLESYLERSPEASDRAEVEKQIGELKAKPARIAITTTPAGATITLDGAPIEGVTPAEVQVPAGPHQVELQLEGHEPVTQSIEAEPGRRHTLNNELTLLAPVVVTPVAEPAPVVEEELAEETSRPTTAIWATGILGATGIVTGTVLGFLAMDANSDYDRNPTEEGADRGEKLALFADVAFGVAIVSIVTGIVLYVTTGEPASDSTAKVTKTGLVSVQPAVGPTGAAATAKFQF